MVRAVRLPSPVSRMPSLHVLASLPNTCIEILHDHQFVRWLHCFQESVQVLCIFFSVTLVYVHCDGDVDGVGRRHRARLATLGLVNDHRLLRGRAFPERPCPQPSCCSTGVPRAFSSGPWFSSMGLRRALHSGVSCCCCTHVTGQEEVLCLLAQRIVGV